MADIVDQLVNENIIGPAAQHPEWVDLCIGLRIDLRLIYQANVDGVEVNQIGTTLWGHHLAMTPELLLHDFDYDVCLGYDRGIMKMHVERSPPGIGFIVKLLSVNCDINFIHDVLFSLVQAGVAIKHVDNENVFNGQNMVVFPE
jgi:hypothetical protein